MAAADPEQRAMMAEAVILLDEDDNVIGHGSKKDTHLMENINKGMLHRAFSVFMFNSEGKLLLQQRSDDKITFPSYWANTCCSHPLYVDTELNGVEGVVNAARRKLEQELGVNPADVPPSCFKFLTRVHYKAASDGIWGEHEIDYILVCTPPTDPVIRPNPNEVQSVRWFTPQQLRSFVADSRTHGDLISPWFRIIEGTLLHKWWDGVRDGDVEPFVDGKIHRAGDFTDPTVAKALGLSDFDDAARGKNPAPGSVGDAGRKQGAYGKVRTHKESVFMQLLHVDEVVAALKFKLKTRRGAFALPAGTPRDYVFCEDILCKVSRSFAAVIQQLPDGLRQSVCVFYLVLRALDTVEDDMEAFDNVEAKIKELLAFHTRLHDATWTLHGVGQADEATLLEQFNNVTTVFQKLPEAHQAVIRDITVRMANGMARFIQRDLQQGTKNMADYEQYCHYVAGLVGHGLSRLFAASGLEDASVADNLELANDMGLFLQKTNIIRDYLEDWVDKRAFWPADVWQKHARGQGLGAFAHGANPAAGLACLNEMVTDALKHAPMCLEYMEQLHHPQVFNFCAIPQVMAIATLEKCFNNKQVFTGVVKIRKGTACKLISQATSMKALYTIFFNYARTMRARTSPSDPCAHETIAALNHLEAVCLAKVPTLRSSSRWSGLTMATLASAVTFIATTYIISHRRHAWGGYMPRITASFDVRYVVVVAVVVFVVSLCCSHDAPPRTRLLFSILPPVSRLVVTSGFRGGAKCWSFGRLGDSLVDAEESIILHAHPPATRNTPLAAWSFDCMDSPSLVCPVPLPLAQVLLVAIAAFCAVFMLAFALVPFVMGITTEMEGASTKAAKAQRPNLHGARSSVAAM